MTDLLPAGTAGDVADIRARMRAEATDTRDRARGWFLGGPSPLTGEPGPAAGFAMQSPPKVRTGLALTGGTKRGRIGAGGEWDWLEEVDRDELRRLHLRRWFTRSSSVTPDELAALLASAGARMPEGDPIGHAAGLWRWHASLADAAGCIANGRMFGRGHLVGLEDVCPVLAAEGYDVAALLDPATVEDELGAHRDRETGDHAHRELFGGCAGPYLAQYGPAPWVMTVETYRAELLTVEQSISEATAGGVDPCPVDVARWLELVPVDNGGRDLDGHLLTAEALHALIVDLATSAGLRSESVAVQTIQTGPDPVGAVEIADRLAVKRGTVDQWRQRATGFPPARWTVGGRPAWEWADIVTWARSTDRLTGWVR